jgi:putative DNA methylase
MSNKNNQLNLFDDNFNALSTDNYQDPALLMDIPFDKVYEAARKEASRKKPAFFIHKYFARRITLNYRMMLIGSLLPKNSDIYEHLYKSYENSDLNGFTVLDPFMGGGTTIFEASRLPMKVIGSDLQPLSNFVTRALVKKIDVEGVKNEVKRLEKTVAPKIMHYQHTTCPVCGKTADIMYTFHAKKVKTNSRCGEHVFYSNYVLAMKKGVFTLVCPDCGEVYEHNFKENGAAVCPSCGRIIKSPTEGNIDHGKFICPECGEEEILSNYTEDSGYPFATKLIAIEYYCPKCGAHGYKRIDAKDEALYEEACNEYEKLKSHLPIPNQDIPVGYNTNQILNHGYKKFSDLFNKRQLLELGLLLNEINHTKNKDIQFWLQLAFSGMLEMNNMFCRYQANAFKICNIFFNHAYVPIVMPVENNVWGTKLGTGNFIKTIDKIIRGKEFCENIYDISTVKKDGKIEVIKKYSNETVECEPVDNVDKLDINKPLLHCGDSRDLSFIPDKTVDMVLTDPPFGANVMYSELIDFFHVWNYKSSIAKDLGFVDPLSPKQKEIIVNETRHLSQEDYSDGLQKVFSECYRVLKDKGLLIFSFHDRALESWESLLRSINEAGFDLIRAYPLHSETRTGAHTSNKNSIALDIMLICKKRQGAKNTYDSSLQKKMNKIALENTENVVNRLNEVEAEITIPDIQNIYLSMYFSEWNKKKIDISDVIVHEKDSINNTLNNLKVIFQDTQIASKRTGWWSELYNEMWKV